MLRGSSLSQPVRSLQTSKMFAKKGKNMVRRVFWKGLTFSTHSGPENLKSPWPKKIVKWNQSISQKISIFENVKKNFVKLIYVCTWFRDFFCLDFLKFSDLMCFSCLIFFVKPLCIVAFSLTGNFHFYHSVDQG